MSNIEYQKISIVMPTLNSIRFLKERMDSILSQTYSNWELIVADSYSNDGTWEKLTNYAIADSRIKLFQVPKNGVYPAINFCIEKSSGDFLYIATSDDTMFSNCLEMMVDVLNKHPDCDICHTSLLVIDEKGDEVLNWWNQRPITRFYGDLEQKANIRYAPYDGILHLVLHMVYGSLTQILLRQGVFHKVGLFRSDWGPRGDFEWGIRVGCVCNTIHIPEKLATWRIHPMQATTSVDGYKLCEMLNEGLKFLEKKHPEIYKKMNLLKFKSFYHRVLLVQEIKKCNSFAEKIIQLVAFLAINPYSVSSAFINFIMRKGYIDYEDNIKFIKSEIKKIGLENSFKVL